MGSTALRAGVVSFILQAQCSGSFSADLGSTVSVLQRVAGALSAHAQPDGPVLASMASEVMGRVGEGGGSVYCGCRRLESVVKSRSQQRLQEGHCRAPCQVLS